MSSETEHAKGPRTRHFGVECSFPECFRPVHSKNLCAWHYKQQRLGRELKPINSKYWENRQSLIPRKDELGRELCLYCERYLESKLFGAYGDMCNRCRHLARYSLSFSQYIQMLERQDSRCAGCGSEESLSRPFHVDHDHACCPQTSRSCGKCIRGLLCSFCNQALGLLKDNTATLRSLITYLEGK